LTVTSKEQHVARLTSHVSGQRGQPARRLTPSRDSWRGATKKLENRNLVRERLFLQH
jgi:hypothetical protein